MVKSVVKIKSAIGPLLKRAGVKRSALFGSFARGDYKKHSDIDIIVEFKKEIGLFGLSDLKDKLERKLKRPVDILTFDSISPFLRQQIEKEKIML